MYIVSTSLDFSKQMIVNTKEVVVRGKIFSSYGASLLN